MKFSLIAAADKKNGIGKNNTLIWRLPSDMKHFAEVTTRVHGDSMENAVIMGKNTWESLPAKHRPLQNRTNIVLSRSSNNQLPEKVILAHSIDEALEKISVLKNIDHIFIIGGASVYAEAIKHPACRTIYLTRLEQTYDCDVFFPKIDENLFVLKDRSGMKHENGIDFEFLTYERRAG